MPYVVTFPDGGKTTYPDVDALRVSFGRLAGYYRVDGNNDIIIRHPLNHARPIRAVFEASKPFELVIVEHMDQAGIAAINSTMTKVFDGKTLPCLNYVETGWDVCVVVITRDAVTQAEAQNLFDEEMTARGIDTDDDPLRTHHGDNR